MAVYVVLAMDDDEKAKTFVKNVLATSEVSSIASVATEYENADISSASVVGVYKKPTQFCESPVGHNKAGFTRGRNYGWWVCARCGKPTEKWASRDSWWGFIGVNLLPAPLAAEYRPAGPESPKVWNDLLEEKTDA